eukprot:COSAG04_NODE_14_length_42641_cov_31.094847_2_plen_624_part_00
MALVTGLAAAAPGAAAGYGFGWFAQMSGRQGRKSFAPMARYSNESVTAEDGGLAEQAAKWSRTVRSNTVFAHTRGGGGLAMADPNNAPPFLIAADPTLTQAAHAAVQKVGVPNLMWMHCGVLPNFRWLRPLLLTKVGRARAALIKGQSDSEHAAALFSSLLVQNRSQVCESAAGEAIAAASKEACERTSRRWVAEEPGACTRMGTTPVDDIDEEGACITAGYTWTPGKSAHCASKDGERYDGDDPESEMTQEKCERTGNHWLAAGASLATKGKQQSVQFSVDELAEALAKLVVELDELDHDAARGELGETAAAAREGDGVGCGPATAGLNVAVGDGRALVLVRARACAATLPPPLYLSTGSAWDAKNGVATRPAEGEPESSALVAVVASEPMTDKLSDVASSWQPIATDEMIAIHSQAAGADGSEQEGPAVMERWCLSKLCLEEVAERPAEDRPPLHPVAVEATPAGALKGGGAAQLKGAVVGADDWKPPAAGTDGEAPAAGAGAGVLGGADDWKPPAAGEAEPAAAADIAVLSEALRGMKLMALQKRAVNGIDESAVETAMEQDDPKAALIALIVSHEATPGGRGAGGAAKATLGGADGWKPDASVKTAASDRGELAFQFGH